MVDTIANALNSLKLADAKNKETVFLKPASKLLGNILEIMKENNYITDYEKQESSGEYKVTLAKKINKCGAIKPRFPVKYPNWEGFETRYLPARDIGLIIVATPQGLMSHEQAKENKIGGKLICYVY